MFRNAIDTDIDIDFADRDHALRNLPHVAATLLSRGDIALHPSGVYFQDAPIDPIVNGCSILYEEAADLGYFKIDFLNNTLYLDVRDENHLNELMEREPVWELLELRDFVDELAHLRDHFGVVQIINPKSVEDLAVVLALIRPGKRHLLGKPRAYIDAEIWKPDPDGYAYKRSHAIAYSVSITVQMNLLFDKLTEDDRETTL